MIIDHKSGPVDCAYIRALILIECPLCTWKKLSLHPWRLYTREDFTSGFPIPPCVRFRHVLFWDVHFGECLLFFGSESVFGLAPKLSLAQLPKTYPKHIYGRWDGKLCTVLEYCMDLQNQKLTWRPEMLISSLTHPFDPSGPERSWRAARRRRRRWARAPPAPPSASARRSRSTRTARSRCPRTATDRYSLIYSLLPYFMAIKASKCPNVLTDLYSDWLRGK